MYKCFFKRLIDFSIALVFLLISCPMFLIIIVWLYFANKGAVFFLQERPGKDEKLFKVIKFKSMTDERDKDGNLLPDSSRLTRVGAFIRKTSIDELPQFINVLKGDMSIIGPRPLLPEYLPYYTSREQLRHSVRPGITGWAQVNGRNNLTWDQKLSLDVDYVENISFLIDLKVVYITIKNVLSSKDVVIVPSTKAGKLNVERADRKIR